MKPELRIFPDLESMSRAAAELVCAAAGESIAARGRFCLALSGGRTPRRLYELLAGSPLPWEKIFFFWGDERCVPKDDPLSNYRLAADALLSRASVPPQNVHPIPVELGSPEAAAKAYEGELRRFFRDSPATFDLILLGLGPDGHTASLFPGAATTEASQRWVTGVAGGQGDPSVPRITLTLPAINASRAALLLAAGPGKKPLIDKAAKGDAPFPAARVRPVERLSWFYAEKE